MACTKFYYLGYIPDFMPNINKLILKKIDSLDVSQEQKRILRELIILQRTKQEKGDKSYFDDYEDILSRNLDGEKD
jgi:hypothetical protein